MTRHISTSIVALATIFAVSAPAQAADVYQGERTTPADAYAQPVAPAKVNWGGFYIGGAIGRGTAEHDLSVRDFFKDYCSDDTEEVDFDPFSNEDREKTLAKRIEVGQSSFDAGNTGFAIAPQDWASCNDVARSDGNRGAGLNQYDAGGLETVSGASQQIDSFNGDTSGLVGDVRLGVDAQRGRFVFGLFGTYGFADMDKSVDHDILDVNGATLATLTSVEKDEEWSLGGRAGFLVNDRALVYILAAYTEAEYNFGGLGKGGGDKSVTFSGATVGGGVEIALTDNLFLGGEVTHSFLGEEDIFSKYDEGSNVGTELSDDLSETKIMGTLKIKLNSDIFN